MERNDVPNPDSWYRIHKQVRIRGDDSMVVSCVVGTFVMLMVVSCVIELVVKYKAEKVCYEEMVKMPLVDLKMLKDESFRMYIDYRELTKIDLYLDCHQMRVHEDEIPRIAFRIRYGHFELTVMPFGLANAPTVFMKLMSRVCMTIFRQVVTVVINDT
nr:hypothetical protein [Tanacetum cinerariifolium]